jgi:hypothetical protein
LRRLRDHQSLKEGKVVPDGIDLTILLVARLERSGMRVP